MKKVLFAILVSVMAFSQTLTGKVIGKVYVKEGSGLFSYTTNYQIICINGVKYISSMYSKYSSGIAPLYNPNGKIETCK